MEFFDAYLLNFNWEENPKGILTSSAKRVLTAEIMQRTFTEFVSDERQRELTIHAATRTGLRMEVENNFDLIVPVRYSPFDHSLPD